MARIVRSMGGLYNYAGAPAGYGFEPWYDSQCDSTIWSTGNGYY